MNFQTDKDTLVTRYRLGTERALEQADLLSNPNMVAIQALTIYLTVLQYSGETKSAWLLAGVLIRVAVSIKLHRDGSHSTNNTAFEIEMRRRLWWQICFIDSRSDDKQVSDYKVSEEMFDTKIPANTDDANMSPEMSNLPVVAEKWTDMTVSLIQCEIWKLSRQLQSIKTASHTSDPDIAKGLKLFQQSQAKIEETYLRLLDPNQPLHSFVATSSRLFLTKISLILHTKQSSAKATEPQRTDTSQSDTVFLSSLSIIEHTYALQNEPAWNGWRWQIQGRQPPWRALRVVLSQLCTRPWNPICDRAWSSAKRTLDNLPESTRTDPRYQQLAALSSTVQRNRADGLHYKNPGGAANSHANTELVTASTLSAPLAQFGISEADSNGTPQELSLTVANGSDDAIFSDFLSSAMDWQGWDEISGDMGPLDFWDMGGL